MTRESGHNFSSRHSRATTSSSEQINDCLAALPSLSHEELKGHWAQIVGGSPPKSFSRRLLIYALAYELQARAKGGLGRRARHALRALASRRSRKSANKTHRLSPGTRLMREWRGTVHVVDVTEDGLVWNGRSYPSLSAIARTITGTRWSGNRFFGLRKRSDSIASGSPPMSAANPEGAEDLTSSSGEAAQTKHPGILNGTLRHPDETGAEFASEAKTMGQDDYGARS